MFYKRLLWVGIDGLYRLSPFSVILYFFVIGDKLSAEVVLANSVVIICRTLSVFFRTRSRLASHLKARDSLFEAHLLSIFFRNLLIFIIFSPVFFWSLGIEIFLFFSIVVLSSVEDFIVFSIQRRCAPLRVMVFSTSLLMTDIFIFHFLYSSNFFENDYTTKMFASFFSLLLGFIGLVVYLRVITLQFSVNRYFSVCWSRFQTEVYAAGLALALLVRGHLIPVTLEGIIDDQDFIMFALAMQFILPALFLYRSVLNTYQREVFVEWRGIKSFSFLPVYIKINLRGISFLTLILILGVIFSSLGLLPVNPSIAFSVSVLTITSLVYLIFNDFMVYDKKLAALALVGLGSVAVYGVLFYCAVHGVIQINWLAPLGAICAAPLAVIPLAYVVGRLRLQEGV